MTKKIKTVKDSTKLKAIVETAVSVIIIIDEKGTIISANKAVRQQFGYEESELIGQNVKVITSSPHREDHDSYLERYLNTGKKKVIGIGRELEALRKDGSTFPIHLSVSEFKDDGKTYFVGFINDLSEVKDRDSKLKAIVETAVSPIITINQSAVIESVNSATCDLFGYEENELLGHNVKILVPEPHHSKHDTYISDHLATGIKKIIGTGRELMAKKKDGTEVPIHLAVSKFHVSGKIYFVGIMTDLSEKDHAVTELKAAKKDLEDKALIQRRQLELYKLLEHDEPLQVKAERLIAFISRLAQAAVGLMYMVQDDQSTAQHIASYCGPSSHRKSSYQKGEGLVGQVLQTGEPITQSVDTTCSLSVDSGIVSIPLKCLHAFPLSYGQNKVAIIELGCPDSAKGLSLGALRFFGETIALHLNSRAKDEKVKELLAETQAKTGDLAIQQEELKAANEALLKSEEELRTQKEVLEKTNDELQQRTIALETEQERLHVKSSELIEAHRLLEEKALELQVHSEYKSEFLATMSHEFRTPLNSILMLSQTMAENRDHNLSPRQTKLLKTIYSSGSDLLNLIDDILDLSKIEAGELAVEARRFEISELVDQVSATVAPLAQNKELDFQVHITGNVTRFVDTDPKRLGQILKNLLSNAIKFTDSGSVELTMAQADDNRIRFEVKDTGIGIAEEKLEEIFHSFRQLDSHNDRQFGGTGLGLTISRKLATSLGGNITVTSTINKGSTFALTIPTHIDETGTVKTTTAEPQPKQTSGVQGHQHPATLTDASNRAHVSEVAVPTMNVVERPSRPTDDRDSIRLGDKFVLIVHHDGGQADILRGFSHASGFKVLQARDSVETIRLAESMQPSGILMELELPSVPGLELIEILQTNSKTQSIPIHAIGPDHLTQQAHAKGAAGTLQSPILKTQVHAALMKIEEQAPTRLKTVLVVEDNENQRLAINELLSPHNLLIVEAATSKDGLNLLTSSNPDCVILDLSLPDMPGLEFLKQAQLIMKQTLPPIVVYTGKEIADDELAAIEQYTSSIIIKGAQSADRLLTETSLMLHSIERQLAKRQRKTIQRSASTERAFQGRTILIADDDSRNRLSLNEALDGYGFHIVMAKNGQEAVNIAQDPNTHIDLILMDMMMPVLDGYQATALLKRSGSTIPVIAVTARGMKGERENCLAAGCDDYVLKPVNVENLISLLRVWLYAAS